MNPRSSEQVVTKTMVVEREAAGAFRVWTEEIRRWWPPGHSLSGDPHTQVFMEGQVGGRFFERTSSGVELEWGRVQVWEPPQRLVFTWYLGSTPQLPTRVEVNFIPLGERTTRVELTHRGPEWVGELWWSRKERFNTAWDSVLAGWVAFLS